MLEYGNMCKKFTWNVHLCDDNNKFDDIHDEPNTDIPKSFQF